MWEGALAPMLLLQVAVKFHRGGAKGIGPEGPPTKASCRDTLEPSQRGIRSKPSNTGS
ncbi:DUF6053 domain-containing protein [Lysobacter gummosus]|uniref:DUF6053 domain-containing protein n=1 Tax=Lysobacter gummosus TaxID=262324 RepID=UPI00363C98D0